MSQQSMAQVGSRALTLLNAGTRGSVLAAFQQVIYLATDSGDLLWIGGSSLPMHARCMRIVGPLPEVRQGDSFWIRRRRIVFETTAWLDFSSASLWTAEPPPEHQRAALRRVVDRARGHAAHMLEGAQPAGFGILLPQILGRSGGGVDGSLQGYEPSLEMARTTLKSMMEASLSDRRQEVLEHASDLIGLGPGLTPSGDDFLGGFLFGIAQLSELYSAIPPLPDLAPLIRLARQRTNLISSTLLLDMAKGIAIEPVHAWVNALLADSPESRARDALQRLTRIGHSTGWDIFTGLVLSIVLSDHRVRCERTHYSSSVFSSRAPVRKGSAHGHQAED